ncbi:MAG: hypothetical protein P4N60_00990 [Verrucomicrobiae bacterium]|nr:hypothetical protein [Verrucomicrobiae bacterium]
MTGESPQPREPFDPLREAARQRIRVIDRPDGGKEFILPALRNFREKIAFTIIWVFLLAALLEIGFINVRVVNELPALVRFIVANHTYYVMGFLGLIELLLTYVCLNLWFRSSRVIAVPGELRVVTHWWFFRRTVTAPADKIIEVRAENTGSVGVDLYYEILVLTTGAKRSRLAWLYPAKGRAGSPFTEHDFQVVNTGGKRIRAATDIKGKPAADWLLSEMTRVTGLKT